MLPTPEKLKKQEELKKQVAEQKLVEDLESWVKNSIEPNIASTGWKGQCSKNIYDNQKFVKAWFLLKSWEATFWTETEQDWSMTAKSYHDYTVFYCRLSPDKGSIR